MLKRGSRTCTRLYRGSSQKRLLIRGSRAVFRDPDYALPQLGYEMVTDSDGTWFEVWFIAPSSLTGNATDGWSWSNGQHDIALSLETSTDLVNWTSGEVEDAAGSPATVTGGYEYRARTIIPSRWSSVLIDLDLASSRGGKEITALSITGTPVSLPNFPYSMPADAATLEADLVSEGFTGATVTTTAAPWTVSIRNYTPGGASVMAATHSGETVTSVAPPGGGSAISLPGYPYALPGDAADLQADLVTAGYSGAVVQLRDDEWAIHVPDIPATDQNRFISATINPGDPYPAWDGFTGAYLGLVPDTAVAGDFSNVRTLGGDPLLERARVFARLRVTRSEP